MTWYSSVWEFILHYKNSWTADITHYCQRNSIRIINIQHAGAWMRILQNSANQFPKFYDSCFIIIVIIRSIRDMFLSDELLERKAN